MAFTPCAFHGRGYAGGASTFFLRLVDGAAQIGGKIQVCANCASEALDYLQKHFVRVSEGDIFYEFAEPLACANCGGDVSASRSLFFGNAYPRGHRESQWYGKVCGACADSVAEDLHLGAAQQRPLA
jgi:hypothetical protein